MELPIFLKIFVSYLIEAKTGNFWMLLISTAIYSVGIGMLRGAYPKFSAEEINACVDNDICPPKALTFAFFVALLLITAGKSGNEKSLEGFFPEQENGSINQREEEDEEKEASGNIATPKDIIHDRKTTWYRALRKKMKGLILRWRWVTVITSLSASFGLPYVFDKWSDLLTFLAWMLGLSIFPLLLGTVFYTPRNHCGTPLSHVFHIMLKTDRSSDNDDPSGTRATQEMQTNLRISGRRSCNAQHLEETKHLGKMVPMSLTFFMFGIVLAMGNTFFIEQANGMKDNLGSIHNFPLQGFVLMQSISKFIAGKLYDKTLAIWIRGRKRSTDAAKIGMGMGISVLCCVCAMLVERKRLRIISKNESADDTLIPITVFWLTPQFVLFGAMEGLTSQGIEGFFSHKGPSSIKEYAVTLAELVTGTGIMLSVSIVWLIRIITRTSESPGWIADTIRDSRLDKFYAFLSVVAAINCCIYIFVAFRYSYKMSKNSEAFHLPNARMQP